MSRLRTGAAVACVLLALSAPLTGQEAATETQATPPPRVGVDAQTPESLSLDAVIRTALEHNQDVAIARLQLDASREDVRAAQGTFDPHLTPSLFYQRATTATVSSIGGSSVWKPVAARGVRRSAAERTDPVARQPLRHRFRRGAAADQQSVRAGEPAVSGVARILVYSAAAEKRRDRSGAARDSAREACRRSHRRAVDAGDDGAAVDDRAGGTGSSRTPSGMCRCSSRR